MRQLNQKDQNLIPLFISVQEPKGFHNNNHGSGRADWIKNRMHYCSICDLDRTWESRDHYNGPNTPTLTWHTPHKTKFSWIAEEISLKCELFTLLSRNVLNNIIIYWHLSPIRGPLLRCLELLLIKIGNHTIKDIIVQAHRMCSR